MIRRCALLLALLVLLPALLLAPRVRGSAGVPTSISLVYPKQKLFKAGDWVFYRVQGSNQNGDSSVDFQRVQIGKVLVYRGEDCFWLETGWGPGPDSLEWGAVMLSENLFLDSLADVRPTIYMRKINMEADSKGTPLASDVRSIDPKHGLPDMSDLRPTYKDLGADTVRTPVGAIPCRLVEVSRTFRSARDTEDSTMQMMTVTTARRWMSLERVPITGIVREEERKAYYMKSWPLGKPSTDFPMREIGFDLTRTELVGYGHGAKPNISDHIIEADPRGGHAAAAE